MLLRMFGRTFDSDWDVPGAQLSHGEVDVTIREGVLADVPSRPTGGTVGTFEWNRLHDGSDHVRWEGMFEFLVAPDGRQIVGRQLGDVHPETLAVYLLNHVVSFSLIKLGDEPIHATVVSVGDHALALCGPPGAGKSTLAARLLAGGGRLVTDDLLVVRWVDGVPSAQVGAARIKLMPDTSARLLVDLADGVALNPNTAKQIVSLPQALVASEEVPLGLVVFLRPPREGRVSVRAVPQRRALLDLVGNTFNPAVETPERLATQFATDVRLAGAVPAVSVTAPHRWDGLETVTERLLDRMGAPEGPLLG